MMKVPTMSEANTAFLDGRTVTLCLDKVETTTGKIIGIRNAKKSGYEVCFYDGRKTVWKPLSHIRIYECYPVD